MIAPPSPHPLFAIGSGFMAAQLLLSAVSLDLFTAIDEQGGDRDRLARSLHVDGAALRLLLDGLVSLELLREIGGRYENTPVTSAYLTAAGVDDLRPFFEQWHRHAYLAWAHLTDALRGRPVGGGWRDDWVSAAAAVAPEAARPLARAPELSGCGHLLVAFDPSAAVVGAILRAHPEARATLAEPSGRHPSLRERLVAQGLSDRVDLLAADPLAGPFGAPYDAAVVLHAMHYQSAERNRALVGQLARALAPGAPLLLVDHWLQACRTRPAYAAVSAPEHWLATGEGRNYTVDEVWAWVEAAGLRPEGHRALVGPASLVVARRAPLPGDPPRGVA